VTIVTMRIMTTILTLTGFALLAEPYDARRPPVYTVWPPVYTVWPPVDTVDRTALSIRTDSHLDEPNGFGAPGADQVKFPPRTSPTFPHVFRRGQATCGKSVSTLAAARPTCTTASGRLAIWRSPALTPGAGAGKSFLPGKRVRFGAK